MSWTPHKIAETWILPGPAGEGMHPSRDARSLAYGYLGLERQLLERDTQIVELSALLRHAGDGWLRRMGPDGRKPYERMWVLSVIGGGVIEMPPDEHGLPIITPDARKEMNL